jgi:phosphatidate cytidylyltransferase
MSKELIKRIITSVFLLIAVYLMFSYIFLLIILLILVSIISWIEFYGLVSKILIKKNIKIRFLKLLIKSLSLIYLTLFSFLIFNGITDNNYQLNMLYLILICIFSDIGGLLFGKIFKGKKLTKISPQKTISGSIGSFLLSLALVPFFQYFLSEKFDSIFDLIMLALIVSLSCQLGDLFISYIKRKAKVKNTGDLLPGHGGFLDRIDGILFAIPLGMILWKSLIS